MKKIFLITAILSQPFFIFSNSLPKLTVLSQEVAVEIETNIVEVETGLGEEKVSSSYMVLLNRGSCFVDFQVFATPPQGLQIISSTSSLSLDEIRLFAIFTSKDIKLKKSDFLFNDIISTTPILATKENFKIDNSTYIHGGDNIPPDRERFVYFKVDTPLSLSSVSGSTITLEIPITFKAIPSDITNVIDTKNVSPLEGATLYLYDGSYIVIPPGALKEEKTITIRLVSNTSVPTKNGEVPILAYELLPHGLVFNKPVEIYLQYPQYLITQNNLDESKLAVYFYDGYEWRLLGGEVDKDRNYIKVRLSHFSYFGIFVAPTITEDDIRPKEKIITPATIDGKNDFASFGIPYGQDFEINIYDISGRRVRKITQDSFCGSIWDGKDELGNIVESGVYIYQVKTEINGEKKIISGTITVAK